MLVGDRDALTRLLNGTSDHDAVSAGVIVDTSWSPLAQFDNDAREWDGWQSPRGRSPSQQLRMVTGGDSAHSQSELIVHFGIDQATEAGVTIQWPSAPRGASVAPTPMASFGQVDGSHFSIFAVLSSPALMLAISLSKKCR